MKKTVFVAAALGCFIQAQAQVSPANTNEKKIKANKAMIQQLLRGQGITGTAQKPTGIQHRVKAQASGEVGGTVDSAMFKYSGSKGSKFDYDNTDFTYNTYFEAYYAPMPMVPQVVNPLNMLADSIHIYDDDTLYSIESAIYRPDNKISSSTSMYPDISGNYYERAANVYNTQGHIITSYMLQSSNGTNFDTLSRRNITYNSSFTQIATDSFFNNNAGTYELNEVYKYYYTSPAKLDSVLLLDNYSGPLAVTQKVTLDYYTDGKVRKISSDAADGSFSAVDSFGYTTGIAYTTLWDSYYSFDGAPSTFGNRTLKYPGTNGLPDSTLRYYQDGSSWELDSKFTYNYTSFDEPETINMYWDDELTGGIRFYYETYDDGISSIPSLTANKDFSLYPNPFRNTISIDWKGKQQNAVKVSLVNILGQQVYSNTINLNSGKNTLELPELGSGNYILLIRDADGKSWSSKVTKQ